MDCISNPVCFFTAVSDAMIHGATFIDYVGSSVAGDHWDSLVPLIEDYTRQLDRLGDMILPRPIGTCGADTALGELNA